MGWYASAMESSPATAYQHLLDYYHACALSVDSELCKVAERCTTLGERAKTATAEVSSVPDYLREIGRRTVAEGLGSIGERNGELSLSALFKRTCVKQYYGHYWMTVSSWPHEEESYCHNLVNTMLETGSTLETSVSEAIAQVSAALNTDPSCRETLTSDLPCRYNSTSRNRREIHRDSL